MLKDLIDIIESWGVKLNEFCYLCIIVYIISKPVLLLIKKFFKKGDL